jgi:hypothetical protein
MAAGLSPRQVDELSLWEFTAAIAGWNKAQGDEKGAQPLTVEEFDALADWLDAPPAWA